MRVKNQLAREFLAEVLGTFLLCVIGLSGVAQFKFFAKEGNHNFFPVNIAFGLGATTAGFLKFFFYITIFDHLI